MLEPQQQHEGVEKEEEVERLCRSFKLLGHEITKKSVTWGSITLVIYDPDSDPAEIARITPLVDIVTKVDAMFNLRDPKYWLPFWHARRLACSFLLNPCQSTSQI